MKMSVSDMQAEAERAQRRKEAINLHRIEGYEFTADQEAMFEMFDREGFTDEQRIQYIKDKYAATASTAAE